MKKRKIVIATHGSLADGLLSALRIVVGECDVEAINCYTTPDFDLDRAIDAVLSGVDFETTQVFAFTDIKGGSVNNGFIKALGRYDFQLFSNVNLAFLVNFILGELDLEEAIEEAQGETFKVFYCNDAVRVASEELDDL